MTNYYCKDLSCRYRWNKDYKTLEYDNELQNGEFENEWNVVEEDLVGEEVTLSEVYRDVENKLGIDNE